MGNSRTRAPCRSDSEHDAERAAAVDHVVQTDLHTHDHPIAEAKAQREVAVEHR